MADSERRQRGLDMLKQVYAGDVVTPPEGFALRASWNDWWLYTRVEEPPPDA